MLSCSHHLRDTIATGRRVALSQRSRIGCVAIYCAIVFCLRVTDFLIPSNPTPPSASARGGYSQIPSVRRRGCFPVILLCYCYCIRRPFLRSLQVYAVLFPPPPRHHRYRPPSGPFTEAQNRLRRNILRYRVLPPCDRLPYPLKPHSPQRLR